MEEVPLSRSVVDNDPSRRAILESTFALLRTSGYASVTIDSIATAAGVPKPTIVALWGSKAQIVLAAIEDHANAITAPETGNFERDLETFMAGSFRLLRGPLGTGIILKALTMEAQVDADFAQQFWKFLDGRRAVLRSIAERHLIVAPSEMEAVVDMIFGGLWYRLVFGQGSVDTTFARTLARLAARAFR